jgi:hypothetical protein
VIDIMVQDKEDAAGWDDVSPSKEEVIDKLNYKNTCEVLTRMGFMIRKTVNEHDERILLFDLWKSLEGDERNGVVPANLMSFLQAVQGI